MTHWRRWALVLLTVAAGVLVLRSCGGPEPPEVPPGLELVVQDDAEFLHRPPSRVDRTLRQIAATGIRRVRVTAGWSELAPDARSARRPAFDASDPASYPQDRWASLDRFLTATRQHGIAAMVDIAFWAPRWATTASPGTARPRTAIDVRAFADFAHAVARRYRGDFRPPGAKEALAPVRLFTIWNEPNHPGFLLPQWERTKRGFRPASPRTYREMVRLGHPRIRDGNPEARVLIGATAGRGSASPDSADDGVPPLRFVRELACVDEGLEPLTTPDCRDFEALPGDGFAHHPYTLRTRPDAPAAHPDDAPLGELGRLTDLLSALAKRGRIDPDASRVYITEYAYETDPPDPGAPYSAREVARLLPWAEYLASANPQVAMHAQFIWRDLPGARRPGGSLDDYQSGLYFEDGRPKPGLAAVRAPLHVTPLEAGRLRFWARVRPGNGPRELRIEARAGRTWREVLAGATDDAGVFTRDIPRGELPGTERFRLRYRLGDRWHAGPEVTPRG